MIGPGRFGGGIGFFFFDDIRYSDDRGIQKKNPGSLPGFKSLLRFENSAVTTVAGHNPPTA